MPRPLLPLSVSTVAESSGARSRQDFSSESVRPKGRKAQKKAPTAGFPSVALIFILKLTAALIDGPFSELGDERL